VLLALFFKINIQQSFVRSILLSKIESCLNNLTSKEAKGYNQPSGWLN